jgi:hypothetical protein
MNTRMEITPRQVHRQALTASLREMAGLLHQLLSRRVTAYLAGEKDAATISRWINGSVSHIRDPLVEQRLRISYEIALLLLQEDSPDVVRAWFVSLNPQLGDATPIDTIHNGELKEALAAARAFVAGG